MTTLFKGFLYTIREEYGASAALKIAKNMWKFNDRIKNMVKMILKVFELEGDDAETIGEFWDVYSEISGIEGVILERSKTSGRHKITKCPWNTPDPKDLSDWCENFWNVINKSINPKVASKRPKGMCTGDSYCEIAWKIED
jgi:hypothetical protein